MIEDGRYCPSCHQPYNSYPELIEARTELKDKSRSMEKAAAERDSARQQYESANTELTNALKNLQYHIEHYPDGCQDGDNCPTNQALYRIAEEAKKNITPDDLTVDLVGQFFKKRGILGVAKIEKDGPYKPFKSIQTGGK